MGKTIIYILLLAILGAGVYYFVFSGRDNTFSDKEAGFTIKDIESVHHIFLVRSNGQSIELQRTDTGWVVNSKYPVKKSTLDILLSTLRKQEAKYPVPENIHNGVVKSLATTSVKVELFDSEGRNIRTFFVGNEAYDYAGTFMLIDGAKKPYVVQLPHFKGSLTPVFTTDIADWRSTNIISMQPEDIREVSVQYPLQPVHSFTMQQNGGVHVTADPAATGGKPLNEQRAKSYLKFFTNVNCEGYLVGIPGIDTTLSYMPNFCNIRIASKQGKQQEVKIFLMPINKRSKNRATGQPEYYDQDRYYAVFNGTSDTAIIQHHTFGKLLRAASEFYEADSTGLDINPSTGIKTSSAPQQ